jgi:hypothetical protein
MSSHVNAFVGVAKLAMSVLVTGSPDPGSARTLHQVLLASLAERRRVDAPHCSQRRNRQRGDRIRRRLRRRGAATRRTSGVVEMLFF